MSSRSVLKTIGKYQLTQEIGSGSIGTVYRAFDSSLEKEVALKIFHTVPDVAPEAKQQFLEQARVCLRLQHPSIVRVNEIGEKDDILYLSMEWLEGVDLRRHIQEARKMSVAEKVEAMAQVADALANAHHFRIVHRDMKPSNVFLTRSGRIKVLDFGLSWLVGARKIMARGYAGTADYLSPEQLLGHAGDSRSDIFSTGVVFCEFLINAHPFEGEFIPRRIVEALPQSLRMRDPQVPGSLEGLLFKALAKDPEKRIQTAGELASGLRQIGEQIRTGRTGSVGRTVLLEDQAKEELDPVEAAQVLTGEELNPSADSTVIRTVAGMIELLREFEKGENAGDGKTARFALERMLLLEAADSRFGAVVADCRARLTIMGESVPDLPTPAGQAAEAGVPPVSPPAPAQRVLVTTGRQGRVTSEGPPLPPAPAEAPIEAQPEPPAQPPAQNLDTVTGAPETSGPEPPPKKPFLPGAWSRTAKMTTAAAGVFIVLGGAIALRPGGAPVVSSYQATAVVQSEESLLMSSLDGPPAVTLRKGAAVQLLALPQSRAQSWVEVQTAGDGKAARGLIRTADLGQWSAQQPTQALALLKAMSAGEMGTSQEIAAEIEELRAFAIKFDSTPQAAQAQLELARLYFALARQGYTGGRPKDEWWSHYQRAKDALMQAAADPRISAQAERLKSQWEAVVTVASDAGALAPPPVRVEAQAQEQILRGPVARYWSTGKYTSAMRLIDDILAAHHNHAGALAWKKKVQDSINFERGVVR